MKTKRIILGSVLVVVAFFALILITPLLFKSKIEKAILTKINSSVNATVAYNDYSLSFIRSFPDLKASFMGVSVAGIDGFKTDTLAYIERLSAYVDVKSILSGGEILITGISIDDAVLNMLVNNEGRRNWEIIPIDSTSDSAAVVSTMQAENFDSLEVEQEQSAPITMSLNSIDITKLDFVYNDDSSHLTFDIVDLNARIDGLMKGLKSEMEIIVISPSVSYIYDSVKYMNNLPVELMTALNADFDNISFSFVPGRTEINDIPVEINGSFSMPYDTVNLDLSFSILDLSFDKLFDLIPSDYQKYLSDFEMNGNFSFGGNIRGNMIGDIYPMIDVKACVKNGKLQYPNLPETLEIKTADLQIKLSEGAIDNLNVDLKLLECSIADNYITLSAGAKNLFSDPFVEAKMLGDIDLSQLPRALPIDAEKLRGKMNIDLFVSGNISDLEKNDFNKFTSKGKVAVDSVLLKTSSMTETLTVDHALVSLSDCDIVVSKLAGEYGNSDFALSGLLDNPLKYFLSKGALKGQFTLQSNYLDVNQMLKSQKKATVQSDSLVAETSDTIVTPKHVDDVSKLPENVDLMFESKVGHIKYDKTDITDFVGKISLRDQKLTLDRLNMNLLGGSLSLVGSVLANGKSTPHAALELKIFDFDLKAAYEQLGIVHKFLPLAKNGEGKITSRLKLDSEIGDSWKLAADKVTASGALTTKNVRLRKTKAMEQLKGVIKIDSIEDLEVGDMEAHFSITNGDLVFAPFSTFLIGQPVSIEGLYNLGGNLDLKVDASVQRDMLSSDIEQIIAYMPGQERITKIDVSVGIAGDAKKPNVSFDKNLIRKQVTDQLKSSSSKEIEDAARKLLKQLFK